MRQTDPQAAATTALVLVDKQPLLGDDDEASEMEPVFTCGATCADAVKNDPLLHDAQWEVVPLRNWLHLLTTAYPASRGPLPVSVFAFYVQSPKSSGPRCRYCGHAPSKHPQAQQEVN